MSPGGSSGDGPSGYVVRSLAALGLGYAIGVALALLVFFSSILLASYLCFRSSSSPARRRPPPPGPPAAAAFVFVSEDEGPTSASSVAPSGLEAAAISAYPTFPYSAAKSSGGGGDEGCCICLCEYGEGEVLRLLPDCGHAYHAGCVDAWLRLSASFPVCRTSPLPTPVSTPLSESAPLAQYLSYPRR